MSQRRNPPSYCHHKATGQAYVRLGGRMIYLGPYGSPESRAEYDRMVAEWLVNDRMALPPDPTVVELAVACFKQVEAYDGKNGAPTCEQACKSRAISHLRKLSGDAPSREFGSTALRAGQPR